MSKSVLICHASRSSAFVLETMLSDAGFDTLVAHSLEEIRKNVKERLPHLVIVGCELEDGCGIDFCKKLKSGSRTTQIPVFIATSEPSEKKAQSAFHAGAEQILKLPIQEETFLNKVYAALRAEERKSYSEIGDQHPYTVLIAEDSLSLLELYKSVLPQLNCTVIGCPDGKAAWNKLTMQGAEVDLIISDINMPRWDGRQLIRAVRGDKRFNKIPIIIATTESSSTVLEEMFELGANDYFVKPFKETEFLCRVKAHLRTRYLIDKQSALTQELNMLNNALENRVRHRTKELEKANMAALNMLAMAAEYKDDTTGLHIQRVHAYVVAIARKLEFDEEQVEQLGYSSIMHDVGKIGIPESILSKPGKLNAQERETIETHTRIGYKLLSQNHFFKLAAEIALHHHEHWDGNGYPNGLKGEKIPVHARIAATADVFDALLSRRSYKEPFSVEQALTIMMEGRGTHFDPDIIDAFFQLNAEGVLQQIIGQYPYNEEKPLF